MKLRPLGKKGAAADGLVTYALLGALVLLVGKEFGWFGTTQATTPVGGQTTGGTATQLACAATTVTVDNENALARGTAPNEYSRLFLMNGQRKEIGYVAEGGTKSLTGGDKVVAYHAINSTTGQSGYYAVKHEYTLPCTGATATYQDNADLYQYDSGLTLTYKNKNGQVVTGQTLAANTKYDLPVSIMSSSQRAYGAPQLKGIATNAVCFQYNSTIITTLNWLVGGQSQNAISTPKSQASNNTVSGQDSISCFSMPILMNTEQVDGVLHVETGATASLNINSINVTTEDVNYYLDTNTLAEGIGFQDNAGTDLGFRGNYLTPIDLTS